MSSLFVFVAESMSLALGDAVSMRLRQLPWWARFASGLLVVLVALIGAGLLILLGLFVWEAGSGLLS